MIRHGLNVAVSVQCMQHGGCRAIEIAVLETCACLVAHLVVNGDRAQEFARGVVLDDRVGAAVDDFAGLRHETDRLVFEFARAPQRRPELFLDAASRLGRDADIGALPDELLARISQPFDERVVDVEVTAVFADGRRHRRRLAKQPFVVVDPDHAASLYEIS